MTKKRGKTLDQYKAEIEFEAFHPGEFLKEEMEARGLDLIATAEQTDVPYNSLKAMYKNEKPMTALDAVRLEKVWGISAETWMGMQVGWDIQEARKAIDVPGFRLAPEKKVHTNLCDCTDDQPIGCEGCICNNTFDI